jgi:hypothetical protein
VNVVLPDEAQRHFEAEDALWRGHRDAPDLLLEEFEEALRHLSTLPESGRRSRASAAVMVHADRRTYFARN